MMMAKVVGIKPPKNKTHLFHCVTFGNVMCCEPFGNVWCVPFSNVWYGNNWNGNPIRKKIAMCMCVGFG